VLSRRGRYVVALAAVSVLGLAGCTGSADKPGSKKAPVAVPAPVGPGVPVPVRGAYWGGTNNNDRSTVPGCATPASYSGEDGQYGGLECKIAWAASRLNLTTPAVSRGQFHTTLARVYLNGDYGCRDDQHRLAPGGDIYQAAHSPGRRALMLSTKCGPWAGLADGGGRSKQDAYLRQVVDLIQKFPVPVILIFHHEPENDACGPGGFGTPDQYRRAYRQFAADVRSRDARDGKSTISTGWVLMNATFVAAGEGDKANFSGCKSWKPNDTSTRNPLRNPENWYPGDDAVDWLAADVYTHGTDTSLRVAVGPFVQWADAGCPAAHPSADWSCTSGRVGKPLGLAEFGFGLGRHTYSQDDKARWFDQLSADISNPAVAEFRRIKAYAYWSAGKQNVIDMPPDAAHPALLAYTRLTLQPFVTELTLPSSASSPPRR
jgi:hypothetical protein